VKHYMFTGIIEICCLTCYSSWNVDPPPFEQWSFWSAVLRFIIHQDMVEHELIRQRLAPIQFNSIHSYIKSKRITRKTIGPLT
jgi:hypothetical protein